MNGADSFCHFEVFPSGETRFSNDHAGVRVSKPDRDASGASCGRGKIDAIRISAAHGLDEIDGRNQMVGFTCLQRELLIKEPVLDCEYLLLIVEAGALAHLGKIYFLTR